MSARLPQREAPSIRELLARATWAELDRITARYNVVVTGRRRELVVERLATLLERPDQLHIAATKLTEPTRLVLGLLMLLGGADDERALAAARDRIVAVRPELRVTLGRTHLPNELQTLQSLGLYFADRRRLVVPAEVLRLQGNLLPPAETSPTPDAQPLPYAALAHTLALLLAAIAEHPPAAVQTQRAAVERVTIYQPSLLTSEAVSELGQRLSMSAADVTLMMSLLETMGAIVSTRGRWVVQPGWHTLSEHTPQTFTGTLLAAWQQPRAFSDLGRTGAFVWRCAAGVECGGSIAQHEATLRTILWRWLGWVGDQSVTIMSLCQTLTAVHPALFDVHDERETWIAPTELRRGASASDVDSATVAFAIVNQLLQQLAFLGLVTTDGTHCALTPLALFMLEDRPYPYVGAAISSTGTDTLLVHPIIVPVPTLRHIQLTSQALPPEGELQRWRITVEGLTKLQSCGISIADFEQELLDGGAELNAEFRNQLHHWQSRAGRIKLHRPLVVVVTAEDAPLAQILAAAGLSNSVEILGPGCALLEADVVDVALERLRARGFWPTTSISAGESYAVS